MRDRREGARLVWCFKMLESSKYWGSYSDIRAWTWTLGLTVSETRAIIVSFLSIMLFGAQFFSAYSHNTRKTQGPGPTSQRPSRTDGICPLGNQPCTTMTSRRCPLPFSVWACLFLFRARHAGRHQEGAADLAPGASRSPRSGSFHPRQESNS